MDTMNTMNKVNEIMEATVKNPASQEVVELAKELDKVRARKREEARREKEIVAKLYEMGVIHKDSDENEEITMDNIVIRKVMAFKQYDVNRARTLCDSLGISRKEIVKRHLTFYVDKNALETLVNEGKVSSDVADSLAIKTSRIYVDVK